MKPNYKRTINAAFMGYVVQAVVNNFIPLLFLTFNKQYNIPLSKITLLITFNFCFQIATDLISTLFVDKIGYKKAAVLADICSAAGLVLLAILPEICKDPFVGIMISVIVYAFGGGLLEVIISPIVEATPSNNKEKTMSLLHSFYCFGHVAVVLISSAFFAIFGIENWRILAVLWALVPIFDIILFSNAPVNKLIESSEQGMSPKVLLTSGFFWLFMLLMLAAGASEQAVSQWASTFAENGLHISKTLGDLCGPAFFAILMGASRAIYGKIGDKINLKLFMAGSAILCILSYLTLAFSPSPVLSLIACGVSGFSVGIFWPGTFSLASSNMKKGGTLLFAFLALFGDLGCSSGPTLTGLVSSANNDSLSTGFMVALIFPVIMLLGICFLLLRKEK